MTKRGRPRKALLTEEQKAMVAAWLAERRVLGKVNDHLRRARSEWRQRRNQIPTRNVMAQRLGVSVSTVDYWCYRVMRK